MSNGYSEFYRHFIAECGYEGLVVDVRFNGGGHVSQHILKALAQSNILNDQQKIEKLVVKKIKLLDNPDTKIKLIASLVRHDYQYQDIKAVIDDLTKKQ